jgi:hypothetical protein
MLDVLINPPKEIPITAEQFKKFTYYEIAAFFCNWKACILRTEEGFQIFTKAGLAYRCLENHRFVKGEEKWFVNESAEVYHCTVKSLRLIAILEKHFKHLFLK